jgi:hypothetical protein
MVALRIALLALIASFVMPRNAEAVTVQTLQKACLNWIVGEKAERESGKKNPKTLFNGMTCRSYVRGVHDTKLALDVLDKQVGPYCFPGKPQIGKIVADFVRWASDNPKHKDVRAATGVMAAFRALYPCKPGFKPRPDLSAGLKVKQLTKRCLDWLKFLKKEKETGQKQQYTRLAEMACKAYIRGAHESKLAHDTFDKKPGPYCMPGDTKINDVVTGFLRWSAVSQKYSGQIAAAGFLAAMKRRFPCT